MATNWQRRKRGRGSGPSNPGAGGCSTAEAQGVTAAQIRERGEVNRQGQRAQASTAPFSLFRIIEKSVGFPNGTHCVLFCLKSHARRSDLVGGMNKLPK